MRNLIWVWPQRELKLPGTNALFPWFPPPVGVPFTSCCLIYYLLTYSVFPLLEPSLPPESGVVLWKFFFKSLLNFPTRFNKKINSNNKTQKAFLSLAAAQTLMKSPRQVHQRSRVNGSLRRETWWWDESACWNTLQIIGPNSAYSDQFGDSYTCRNHKSHWASWSFSSSSLFWSFCSMHEWRGFSLSVQSEEGKSLSFNLLLH